MLKVVKKKSLFSSCWVPSLIEALHYGGETFSCCAVCNLKFWDLTKVLIAVTHDFGVASLWKLKTFWLCTSGEMPSIAAVDWRSLSQAFNFAK